MSGEKDLDRARDQAAAAREQLLADAHAVQARLKPAALASNAIEGVRTRSEAIADSAAEIARRRPVAIGAAAVAAVALLARKPIGRLFARITRKKPTVPAPRRARPSSGDDR